MLRWREAISPYSGQDEKEGSCSGNVKIIHRLPTSHRQVWINQGDIILISLRDFQDDKADVIVKYTADEARSCASPYPFTRHPIWAPPDL